MQNHWLFWGFWVSVNAIASYAWGVLLITPTVASMGGMLLGILIFIITYAVFDQYLLNKNHLRWHNALRKGVFTKAALQLLNLSVFINLPLAPEFWAGMASIFISSNVLVLSERDYPFLFTLVNTLLTGFFLSLMVAVISLIFWLISNAKAKVSANP